MGSSASKSESVSGASKIPAPIIEDGWAMWKVREAFFDACKDSGLEAASGFTGTIYCKNYAQDETDKYFNLPPRTDCFADVWNYLYGLLKYKLGLTTLIPVDPGTMCWYGAGVSVVGILMGIIMIVVVIAAVVMMLSDFLGPVEWGISKVLGLFGFTADWTSGFVTRVGNFIIGNESTVVIGAKYLLDIFRDVYEVIISYTNVNNVLLGVNALTLALVLLSEVAIDAIEVEHRWEGSYFDVIYHILNWPIELVLDVVEHFTGGKGFIYYLGQFFALPYQAGALVLSMVIGGIVFVVEQLIAVIKEDAESEQSLDE